MREETKDSVRTLGVLHASYLILFACLCTACGNRHGTVRSPDGKGTVRIDVWFMSQCPYAGDMFMELPGAFEALGGAASLQIHAVLAKSPDGDGFSSLHGQGEVVADVLLLCAADVSGSPLATARFLSCIAARQMLLPFGWEECADEASIPLDPVKACTLGQRGIDLLEASASEAEEKGISSSPYVLVDGVPSPAARDEAGLVEAACCAMAAASRPDACPDQPTCYNVPVSLTVITDERCEACAGQVQGMIETIALPFRLVEPEILDWSDPAAKAMLASAGVGLLPAFFFPSGVKELGGFETMAEFTFDAGDWTVIRPQAVEAEFDPEAEICDNGKDDTGDGKADCSDPGCKEAIPCRPETPGTLDLFVMAHCPYGIEALAAAHEAYLHFGGKLAVRIHWIATEVTVEEMAALDMPDLCAKAGGHAFCSIHGVAETADSLFQICAQSMAATGQFVSFSRCTGGGEKTGMDLEGCADAVGLDSAAVGECAAGDQGAALLSADVALGNALGMDSSPSFLWNNTLVEYVDPTPASIAGKACQVTEGLEGCDDLSGLDGAAGPPGAGKQCGQ